MHDENKIDPGHARPRNTLRKAGLTTLGTGALLTVIGVVGSFAFISMGRIPCFFVLVFIGMPMMFVGTIMTIAGYMGKIARYTQAETAPVAKDTFNYLADGTQEGVKTIATAIGQGIGAGIGSGTSEAETKIRCHKCNFTETTDAKFCSKCGTPLEKSKPCPSCNELNDPDAKFCDNCGYNF